jgi:hypothetical protein
MEAMSATEQRENFKLWFVSVLKDLANNPHGGFATMMIALPLLERYLREKTSNFEEIRLTPEFYQELGHCFLGLQSKDTARNFWAIFRNGILHQGTFRRLQTGTQPESGELASCSKAIETDAKGNFVVNPVKFADAVVKIIEADFDTFEARGSPLHRLAEVASNTTITPSIST